MEKSPHKLLIFCFLLSISVSASSIRSCERLEAFKSHLSLDNVLKEYAVRAFIHPKTGIIYNAQVPENMSGIQVHAVRLRSGSLRSRGFLFNEFEIPKEVVVKPYVERLVLVYHNLGNLSSFYYSSLGTNMGFRLVAPVLGLLAYSSSNLSSANIHEARILATKTPIKVRFKGVNLTKGVATPMCIFFYLNGSMSLINMDASKVCTGYEQGHVSLVVESPAPASGPSPTVASIVSGISPAPIVSGVSPAPSGIVPKSIPYMSKKITKKQKPHTLKIAILCFLGGLMVMGMIGVLGFWVKKKRKKSMITKMENEAEQGEALQSALIGHTRAPAAYGLRTQPKLENEYIT